MNILNNGIIELSKLGVSVIAVYLMYRLCTSLIERIPKDE